MSDAQNPMATAITYAMMHMLDLEVRQFWDREGVNNCWTLALDIAENGPQNDMERRIVAEAMVRRLEGK